MLLVTGLISSLFGTAVARVFFLGMTASMFGMIVFFVTTTIFLGFTLGLVTVIALFLGAGSTAVMLAFRTSVHIFLGARTLA